MHEVTLAFFAFIEGVALILSPCILPILPIMLSGSVTGSKSRPFGIILGFIVTFMIVTLFSRTLVQLLHLPQETLRNISFGILILLGIVMLSEGLTEKFAQWTNRLVTVGSSINSINNINSGFIGGLLFGGLIGFIWTPCAGPILASVIVQVVIQKTNWQSILMLIAFSVGVATPMLLIALMGRKLINYSSYIKNHLLLFRKLLGALIILSVIYLMMGSSFLSSTKITSSEQSSSTTLLNNLSMPYKAPAISGIDAWINSPPLTLDALKGKVVLIDFWTYSCINCIRTLPYLKDWYAKYHALGFEIIGIHSPEFSFEQDESNVKNAVKKFGIMYPVALDNQFVTWQNYANHYWPAHYLINQQGDVVYTHFGEGEYDITENNIRYLLGVNNAPMSTISRETFNSSQTPETYFGYNRLDRYFSPEGVIKNKTSIYSYPGFLPLDGWALSGAWQINADHIIAMQKGAGIKLHFKAVKVFAVMGAGNQIVHVTLTQENSNYKKQIDVRATELYTLINGSSIQEGTIELVADQAGLEMYTFTFG